jgi:hypothetical protein
MNNLQAQRDGESDRAYRCGYLVYRDLGEGRTILAAYRIYLKSSTRKNANNSHKIPSSASPNFKRWATVFDWEARARDWDLQKADRIRKSLLEADRQSYTNRIESSRSQLERTATMGMKAAETALTLSLVQLQDIAKESQHGILSKEKIDRLLLITRISKDAIGILSGAKTELYDALGLVKTIEDLAAINDC